MALILGTVVRCAITIGMAFILGTTLPYMPNKVARFILLFVLGVPFVFLANYCDVRFLEYHPMGRAGVVVIALVLATFGTFFVPESHKSNTP